MNNILQMYGGSSCTTYYLSRVVYICNFALVSISLFFWTYDFTLKEARVINTTVFGVCVFIINVLFITLVNINHLLFVITSDNSCTKYESTIQSLNTWTCTACLFSLSPPPGSFLFAAFRFSVSREGGIKAA